MGGAGEVGLDGGDLRAVAGKSQTPTSEGHIAVMTPIGMLAPIAMG